MHKEYDFSKARRAGDVPHLAELQNKVEVTRWDSAEHLKTEEDIQLYMEACLKEAGDDAAFIDHALDVIARSKVKGFVVRNDAFDRFIEACEKDTTPNQALLGALKFAKERGIS